MSWMDETLKRAAVTAAAPQAPTTPDKLHTTTITPGWLERATPPLVGAVALIFGLIRLGAPSLWMDEAFSVQLSRQPLTTLEAAFTSGSEPNMIGYHFLLHYWLAFGSAVGLRASEAFVRFPSAIFAALSAVVLYLLGRRFLGQTAALVAAIIYMASGWQLTYAQEARGYAMQLLFVTLGWLALLAAVSITPQENGWRDWRAWRWWGVFALAMAVAMYAQAFTALVLLAQGLTFLVWLIWPNPWRNRARQAFFPAVAAAIVVGALIAPLAYVSRHGSKTGWLPSPNLSELTSKLNSLLGTGKHAALIVGGLVAVVVIVAALAWLLLTPAGKRALGRVPALTRFGRADGGALVGDVWPVALGLALWVVAPVVVSYVVSLGPTRIFSSRYLVVIWPALCLGLGMAVAALRWPVARAALLALVPIVMLVLAPSYYAHAQVEDWRTPVRWLEREYQPGDGLVSYNNVQGAELPVDYYLTTDGSPAHFDANSPGKIVWSLYGHGDPFATYEQALNPTALAAYAAQHPRIFFIEGRFTDAADEAKAHAAQAWLDSHYRFISQTSSGVVTIRLYVTNGA